MEEICNLKKLAESKLQDSGKQNSTRLFKTLPPKKFRVVHNCFISLSRILGRVRPRSSNLRHLIKLTTSVSSVCNVNRPICEHCGKNHFSECRAKIKTCF